MFEHIHHSSCSAQYVRRVGRSYQLMLPINTCVFENGLNEDGNICFAAILNE